MRRLLAILALTTAGCAGRLTATTTPLQPTLTPDFATTICAGIDYAGCVSSMRLALPGWSGKLVAICTYPDHQGDIVLIDKKAQANSKCSGGGLLAGSDVAKVLRLP